MPNAIIRFRQARTPRSIVLAATTVVLTRGATAQSGQHPVDEFLARTVVLTPAETTSLARGDAVARILRTGENQDVAVFGAVRINVSRSFFMDGQRDLPRALRSPMRTQVHLFSEPATVADVEALIVSDDDVKELRKCKPNECNFKLPATDMERLKRTIDLSAPDATANAATYARQRMVDYTTDYRARGNAAMLVYEDRGVVRASDAFAAMLRDSSYLFSAVPSLGDYFLNYPRHAPVGSTDAIFWSRDEMQNLRPVLRITHQVIYSPSDVPELSLVAAKQIYANHYFEAGLEVLAAADRTASAATGGEPGITVIAVRRYRFDHLPSGGVVNLRSRVTNGLRDNVRADLARLKRESEAARGAHDR